LKDNSVDQSTNQSVNFGQQVTAFYRTERIVIKLIIIKCSISLFASYTGASSLAKVVAQPTEWKR